MMALLRFFSRFVRRHWFPLLLAGIAVYVMLQKELRVVLYFQKPEVGIAVQEEAAGEEKAADEKEEGGGEGSLMGVFGWGGLRRTQPSGLRQAQPAGLSSSKSAGLSSSKSAGLSEQLAAVSREEQLAYLKRFARVAIAERRKFGLPSSLILAVSLLNSTAGRAEPAVSGNNHFALPCTDLWEGKRVESGGVCYRAYENAWASFRDFSLYASALAASDKPEVTDYKAWLKTLKGAGFVPDGKWQAEVERLIGEFRLYELDVK